MPVNQVLNSIKYPVAANLKPPMPSINRLAKLMGNLLELNLTSPCEQLLNILVKVPRDSL